MKLIQMSVVFTVHEIIIMFPLLKMGLDFKLKQTKNQMNSIFQTFFLISIFLVFFYEFTNHKLNQLNIIIKKSYYIKHINIGQQNDTKNAFQFGWNKKRQHCGTLNIKLKVEYMKRRQSLFFFYVFFRQFFPYKFSFFLFCLVSVP